MRLDKLLTAAGLSPDPEAVTIGTLMLLVPGMALTSAMREIMAGDVFSGLERTAEVILTASAMPLGTALPRALGDSAPAGSGARPPKKEFLVYSSMCCVPAEILV